MSDAYATWPGMSIADDWEAWRALLTVPGEDLSKVITRVALQRRTDTRTRWANDWRTREFANLGLHLLYLHHIRPDTTGNTPLQETSLFGKISAAALERHAQEVIKNPADADRLSAQQHRDLWGNDTNYLADLISYLFRPSVFLARVASMRATLLAWVETHSLLEFLTRAAQAELESALADPVGALQTVVMTALAGSMEVSALARQVETQALREWSNLYATVFPLYGLQLPSSYTWDDLAEELTTAGEGILIRARASRKVPLLSNGTPVFTRIVLGIFQTAFGISHAEMAVRRVREVPPDS